MEKVDDERGAVQYSASWFDCSGGASNSGHDDMSELPLRWARIALSRVISSLSLMCIPLTACRLPDSIYLRYSQVKATVSIRAAN